MPEKNRRTGVGRAGGPAQKDRVTKKDRIVELFQSGKVDLIEIARVLDTQISYVARVLMDQGLLHGYFDLYTPSAYSMNVYSALFQRRLGFKDVETARQSVQAIDAAYQALERRGDRAGQHHAQVMALTCLNRARWSGKAAESLVFKEWLISHLDPPPQNEAAAPDGTESAGAEPTAAVPDGRAPRPAA